jgi:hypothetical protein
MAKTLLQQASELNAGVDVPAGGVGKSLLEKAKMMNASPVDQGSNVNGLEYYLNLQNTNNKPKPAMNDGIAQYGQGLIKDVLNTTKGMSTLGENMFKSFGRLITPKSWEEKLGFAETPTSSAQDLQNIVEDKLKMAPGTLTTPTNPAEKAGFITGQMLEFLLPSSKIAKLEKGTSLLTRAGIEATTFGGQTAMQQGSFNDEAKTSALIGAAFPVVGAVIKEVVKPIKSYIGKGLAEGSESGLFKIIKPVKSDIDKGFKVENVFKHDVSGSLGTILAKTETKLNNLYTELKSGLKTATNAGAKVDFNKVLEETYSDLFNKTQRSVKLVDGIRTEAQNAIGTAINENAYKNFTETGGVKRIFKNLVDDLKTVTDGTFQAGLYESNLIKQGAGTKGSWHYLVSPDAKAMDIVYNSFYDKLKTSIEKVGKESGVKNIERLNKEMSELIPIKSAVIRRMPVADRNNAISLTDSILGLGAMFNPKALALLGLSKLSKSGGFMSYLHRAGENLQGLRTVERGAIGERLFGGDIKDLKNLPAGLSIEDVTKNPEKYAELMNKGFKGYDKPIPVTRYAEKGKEISDKVRGGTWYTVGEEKNYKFGPENIGGIRGVGGSGKFAGDIKIKNPLVVPNAMLEDGSFAVINSGMEKALPEKQSKLAEFLYEGGYSVESENESKNLVRQVLNRNGNTPEEIRMAIENSNRGDVAMDLIISKGLKESGYDSLVLENIGRDKQVADRHIFDFSGKNTPKTRVESTIKPQIKKFEGFSDLSTKTLEKLKGRDVVSKEFIENLTNQPDLKQNERELIREILKSEGDKVNVAVFADKVKAEILPLKVNSSGRGGNYENIALPDNLRGEVKNYKENIYESPVKTKAGDVHFPGEHARDYFPDEWDSKAEYDAYYNDFMENNVDRGTDNYFGHTRIEDMADNETRRVIEVQSDLYQKGNLEREAGPYLKDNIKTMSGVDKKKAQERAKLLQYSNPTAHFRMAREEIRNASKDGKKYAQFPTGDTAMEIEGLKGSNNHWREPFGFDTPGPKITTKQLEVGKEIVNGMAGTEWIITKVEGDGKFRAVAKKEFDKVGYLGKELSREEKLKKFNLSENIGLTEQFNISGKVDENNPIYKFYEKDLGKYLKSKFNASLIKDKNGVQWYQVDVKPEWKSMPVEAFGIGAMAIPAGVKIRKESQTSKSDKKLRTR